ncbi:hypothetical protein AZI85_02055 [Bdellovibrio bacteriovorus]|uniref:Putative Flp pilus-assembly TadG-like N-terminal domain-containing protein n=1 Tax=Bdellovibrio bacteriovorus TaxID=959 RepID=A0A150WWC8_BDEBC|nr:Tad domain-containing protein [Bdellovibrio bacteriovorus]KYG70739.1 hypothetical protein AZI85_02055 [Bdellovibrio bacteriovorus]
MLNRRSTFNQNLKNRKGQVALFVALIFQILFLFFAMVINVGLLVHHKINLQNSVDLAAYYAASKQAENMNSIAHMNYQIRQSWKLLAWRYRMLGSAGEWYQHPYDKTTRQLKSGMLDDIVNTTNPIARDYQIAPPFCITYIPFKPMPPGENTCRNMASMRSTRLWDAPGVIAGHQAFSRQINNASNVLKNNAIQRCMYFGSYNYLMLAKFVVGYNLDQNNRMEAIKHLSRATSGTKSDFYDIDGQSVKTGVEKTLANNLTAANRSTVRMDMFNSLGSGECNAEGLADGAPAKWLTPIRIYPGFRYIDTICGVNNEIKIVAKEHSNNPYSFPHHKGNTEMSGSIDKMAEWIGYRTDLNDNFNFSIGVEKNPWCMAYTGVSATTQPKIPFSPLGAITLKARAFYKPFGGRVGPWYYKNWNRGSRWSEGNPNDKTDPNMAPRVTDTAALSTISESSEGVETRAANFSRFVGDKFGLKTYKMLGHYGKAIYELDSGWRNGTAPSDDSSGNSVYDGVDAPNFAHWDDLPFDFINRGGSGDVMAFDRVANRPSPMRILEMAAILPDTFDTAYYSIEPDFYHNYYLRLKNGFFAGPGTAFSSSQDLRPDLGYRRGYKQGSYDYEKFSVKDQFQVINDPGDLVNTRGLVKDQFTFTLSDWKHVLTSWAPVGLNNYSLDTNKFGKCTDLPKGADNNSPNPPTPGNCIIGGTTGYAVKMVSSDYLRSADLKLGGEAAGAGPLLNPPPGDDEF